jgi:hypothetical protein
MGLWIVVGLGLLAWVADCCHRPYIVCRHCGGEGRDWDAEYEHFRKIHCTWCTEGGYRLRWELRLLSVPF